MQCNMTCNMHHAMQHVCDHVCCCRSSCTQCTTSSLIVSMSMSMRTAIDCDVCRSTCTQCTTSSLIVSMSMSMRTAIDCDACRCYNMPKKGLFCQRRPTIGKPPKTPFLGGFPRTPEIPPSRARGGNPGNPGFSPGASWGEKVPKNDPKNGPFFDPFFLGNPALRPLFLGGISGAPKIRPQKCPKNAQKKGYLITLPFGTLFWVFSRGGFWGVFGGFRGIPPKSGFLGVRYRGYPTTFQRHVTQHATTYNMQCNMYATCNATCNATCS